MSDNQNSSFIPKRAAYTPVRRKRRQIYIFSYVSYTFFFGALLAVVSVYVYSAFMESRLTDARDRLLAQQQQFNANALTEVRVFGRKLDIASELVESQASLAALFAKLETVIADPFFLTNLEYERISTREHQLVFEGSTDSFDAAIFQRDVFAASDLFENPVVEKIAYGDEIEESAEAQGGDGLAAPVPERLRLTFEMNTDHDAMPYTVALPEAAFEETGNGLIATTTDELFSGGSEAATVTESANNDSE